MCCDVLNIPSRTGEELEMGRYMRQALEETGLSVSWQEVEEGRANVVGLWEGTANGKSLLFNGHMDTSNTGREEFLTGIGYKPKAIIKNGFIYGLGHYVHTGFHRGKQDQSSVFRMKEILPAIHDWIAAWEKKAVYDGQPGVVNVGCIRGGHPWRVSRTPDRTDVFLDVRVPPAMPLKEVRVSIKQLVLDLRKKHPDYGVEYETFVSVPGAEISKDHPLVKNIAA